MGQSDVGLSGEDGRTEDTECRTAGSRWVGRRRMSAAGTCGVVKVCQHYAIQRAVEYNNVN